MDVVVGHRHASAALDHDFADLRHRGVAGLAAIVGAPEEVVPLATGDHRVDAPDAMVVRCGFLARQADRQIEAVAIPVLDQQWMVAALGHRHGEVGHREQLGFAGERHELQLHGVQRRWGDALLVRDGMDVGEEFLGGTRAPGCDVHGNPPRPSQMCWITLSVPMMCRPTISICGSIACRCWLALMASRKRRSKGAEFMIAVVPAAR